MSDAIAAMLADDAAIAHAETLAPPYEVPGPPIRALKPITDPLALKERTVRDYTHSMGGPGVSSVDIEALAVADLNLADAFKRDEVPRTMPTPEQRAADKAARDAAIEAELAKDGLTLTRNAPRELGPQFDLPPEYGLSERWQAAKGRLMRILAGCGEPTRLPSGAYDFRAMTATAECPGLAYTFLCHWFDFDLRYEPKTARHNPYFMMSHRDASLKLARLVEDLCDQSTGIPGLGAWRTEK